MARETPKVIPETNVVRHLLTTPAEVRLAARASGVGLRPLQGRIRTIMALPQQLARPLLPPPPTNKVRIKVLNNLRS